jgi:hypothetical protein
VLQNTKTNSKPSELKIADLRTAVVAGNPFTVPLLRIDSNQGISGSGEVRDGTCKIYALALKIRILGEIPVISTGYIERSSSSVSTHGKAAAVLRWFQRMR